jgi:hypothetical protein
MRRRLQFSRTILLAGLVSAAAGMIASSAAAAEPRADEYRRPELVAICWQHAEEGRFQEVQPAWRPDGTMLDETEAKWLHKELGSFDLQRIDPDVKHLPLVLIFRIDERARSPQSLIVSYRRDGKSTPCGAGQDSQKSFLAHSTLSPRKTDMSQWGPEVDFEVKVPIGEPELLKRIEPIPAERIDLDKGVSWYVDPQRGRSRVVNNALKSVEGKPIGRAVLGVPATVLDVSYADADPLCVYAADVRLKNGESLQSQYVTVYGDPPKHHMIRVSRPIEESNPVASAEFRRTRHRMELYEKIPTHLELKPKEIK